MSIDWQRVAPVIVSIFIIVAVALVRNYSKTLAAVAATMPINIPLAMWIVFSGDDNPTTRLAFSEGMLIGIFPTMLFLIVSVVVVRAGWALLPTLLVGYVAWGVSLLALFMLRRSL